MKYFFDNCISPNYVTMLRSLDVEATALVERFPADIADPELFKALKDSFFVFVSVDRKQQTRVREYKALKEAGLTAIWFGPFWNKLKFWDQAIWMVRHWQMIDGYLRGAVEGTCAEIKQNGKADAFTL